MDKRVGFWAGLVVIGVLVVTETQLVNTLIAFFILGMIPGTNLVLPAWFIVIVYPLLFIGLIYWIRTQPLFIGETAKVVVPAKAKSVKPKKAATTRGKQAAAKRRPRTA